MPRACASTPYANTCNRDIEIDGAAATNIVPSCWLSVASSLGSDGDLADGFT